MKIRKIIAGAVSVLIMGGALPVSQAFAVAGDGGYTADQIAASALKPVMTISKEVISLEEAKANPTRTITVSINEPSQTGGYYASTGMYFLYDERLTIELNKIGNLDIQPGEAIESASVRFRALPEAPSGFSGFLELTSDSSNSGKNGEFLTFNVTLPDNAMPGDVFPIDIVFYEDDFTSSLFCPIMKNTEQSKLMQAYLFTQGIFTPEHTVTADDDPDGFIVGTSYDGYIAIAPEEAPAVTYGDVNGDSAVNLNDAVAVLQYVALAAKYPLEGSVLEAADVCDNGTSGVNGSDALAIMMVDAGLLTAKQLPISSAEL